MAVKVMTAPAIARGEVAGGAPRKLRAPAEKAPRTKRRRSSVFDAEGNEVFITLMCLKCRKIRPLSQFGLRKMSDGSIRNQPWCRPCRSAPAVSAAGPEASAQSQASPAAEESPVPGDSRSAPSSPVPVSGPERRTGSVAAEVAAALAAGRG